MQQVPAHLFDSIFNSIRAAGAQAVVVPVPNVLARASTASWMACFWPRPPSQFPPPAEQAVSKRYSEVTRVPVNLYKTL